MTAVVLDISPRPYAGFRIVSPRDGGPVSQRGTKVTADGRYLGFNNYLIVESVDDPEPWVQFQITDPRISEEAQFGQDYTPSGSRFLIYVLSTKSVLPVGKIEVPLEAPRRWPAITVTLVKPVARNDAAPWIRIADLSEVHIDKRADGPGGATVERLEGVVRGAISRSDASVFLLWRTARQCFHPATSAGSGLKGASIPACEERDAPDDLWDAREAVVDASGNWSASVGPMEVTLGQDGPWVEFWQFQGVATLERQALADSITPFGTLAASRADELPHLMCSEPRTFSYSEEFSGFWRAFEPTQMGGLCK